MKNIARVFQPSIISCSKGAHVKQNTTSLHHQAAPQILIWRDKSTYKGLDIIW